MAARKSPPLLCGRSDRVAPKGMSIFFTPSQVIAQTFDVTARLQPCPPFNFQTRCLRTYPSWVKSAIRNRKSAIGNPAIGNPKLLFKGSS